MALAPLDTKNANEEHCYPKDAMTFEQARQTATELSEGGKYRTLVQDQQKFKKDDKRWCIYVWY